MTKNKKPNLNRRNFLKKASAAAVGAGTMIASTSSEAGPVGTPKAPEKPIHEDLLKNFNGEFDKTLYWSRAPGKFVNKETGHEIKIPESLEPGPVFTGSAREWYETLVETIIDNMNTLSRVYYKNLLDRGIIKKNPEQVPDDVEFFVIPGDSSLCLLECSVFYKVAYDHNRDSRDFHPLEHAGSLNNRSKVLSLPSGGKSVLFDPIVPRNKIYVVLNDKTNNITHYGCVHVLDMNII